MPKIRCFKRGYRNGWELNVIGHVWNLRVARYQLGLWRNYVPVVNWIA